MLSDGSLQVINSSSVFHESTVATLSCSSREEGEEFTLPVLLQGQSTQNQLHVSGATHTVVCRYKIDDVFLLWIIVVVSRSTG